jgi:hypothetical protein
VRALFGDVAIAFLFSENVSSSQADWFGSWVEIVPVTLKGRSGEYLGKEDFVMMMMMLLLLHGIQVVIKSLLVIAMVKLTFGGDLQFEFGEEANQRNNQPI